jgi:hypothetical protein
MLGFLGHVASRRPRAQIARADLVEEARGQVDCCVEEVEAAAERGAVAVVINSQSTSSRSAEASISRMLSVRPSLAISSA